MLDQPFVKLIDALAARTPTPGGGAAAAMAGCMGTALFLMVVRFSRGKKANVDREGELVRAESQLDDCRQRLLPMAELDCRSFDAVSAAYGMSKDTDGQKVARSRAIQEALVGAMVVPEQTLGMVREVFTVMQGVIGCVGKTIASDLAAGAALLLAAGEGAFLNVQINAGSLEDKDLAGRTMERAFAVRDEIRRQQAAFGKRVDEMLA